MKRTRQRREHHAIKSLPNDLLMEVLVKVASASLTDLLKLKLSCKDFCGLVEDDYIFQHVSLKELPLVWCTRDEVLSFLKRCKQSGNPDALFREGIYGYFSSKNPGLGLEFLEKASKKEHIEATYMYGLILICSGGPLKQHGFQLLSSLITSKLNGSRIKECRRRVKDCIRSMWIKNNMARDQEPYCPKETCCNYGRIPNSLTAKRAGWLSNDYIENEDDKFTCCEYCRCHHEVHLFCNMLQGK
ncbi:putative F-box protein At1g67623 [Corylus avellana]|uniref:putative F-box protein At1g67623 n=1 Tax=Corylus avellana TaxID=13451 RepID=UPI00286AFEDA|nr:putative F-box protein At1g67623 [Corylus avellana]